MALFGGNNQQFDPVTLAQQQQLREQQEVQAAFQRGLVSLSLGKNVLRAETAAMAAASIFLLR